MESKRIKEVIVVEGKDDITRVTEALDATIIATGGIHINRKKLDEIVEITKDRGAIILTDPDHAGNIIREKLVKNLKCPVKIAYFKQSLAIKDGDIGIENAKKEDIIEAINKARPTYVSKTENFSAEFLFEQRLTGFDDSKKRREYLSERLNLGNPNAKTLLKRLNNFGIDKEEVIKILEEYSEGQNI